MIRSLHEYHLVCSNLVELSVRESSDGIKLQNIDIIVEILDRLLQFSFSVQVHWHCSTTSRITSNCYGVAYQRLVIHFLQFLDGYGISNTRFYFQSFDLSNSILFDQKSIVYTAARGKMSMIATQTFVSPGLSSTGSQLIRMTMSTIQRSQIQFLKED